MSMPRRWISRLSPTLGHGVGGETRTGSPSRLALLNRARGSSNVVTELAETGAAHWRRRPKGARGRRSSRYALSGILGRAGGLLFLAFLGVGALWPSRADAQGPNAGAGTFDPDWSGPAAKLLRVAAEHAQGKQWSEAVQKYQQVIDQYGNKVTALVADDRAAAQATEFVLYVDDRWYCHRAIAKLPPEARAIYRRRVDAITEGWFRQGQSQRDPSLLRRVVDQAFCSAWGDDALELLGDLAFQDGRLGEARAAYERIVADRPDDSLSLVHPDPSVDLARVAAKKLLCRAAAGESPPGPADLAEFRRRYPGASGKLAGREGGYAEILAEALESDRLGPPREPDSRWPTFAGSYQRTRVAPAPIDVGSLQWRIDIEKVPLAQVPGYVNQRMLGGATVSTPSAEKLLAFHPIVLGEQVIVCDGSRVLAYNLNDRPGEGEPSGAKLVIPVWKYPPDEDAQVPQARSSSPPIPRYTLTAFGNRIYARMGLHGPPDGGMRFRPTPSTNSIVALDWSTQGKFLWEQKSNAVALPNRPHDRNGNRTVSFEGTPVADERNVYLALTDRQQNKNELYVACLDAETGAVRWVRYVGAGSPLGNNNINNFGGFGMQPTPPPDDDYNHRLLSLEGTTLYYQTNLGALAAIDAATGSTLWVASYPRQDQRVAGSSADRDLNPAVIHDGRVFVAPADADAIFAFDSASGRLLWQSDRRIADDIKLSHVLGVAKGRLVVTGNRVVLLNEKTGALVQAWPDAGKALDGYGRGLLAGDKIYWPTQNEIEVLDQRTGLRTEPPIKLLESFHTKGGNLVAGDGYLVVAQSDGLVVFCQNSRLMERFRQQITAAPERRRQLLPAGAGGRGGRRPGRRA